TAGINTPAAALTRLTDAAEDFTVAASIEVSLTAGRVSIELDTRGTVDVAAEKARLVKDLVAAEREIVATEAKLANSAFTGKAPEQVVAKIRLRNDSATEERNRLQLRLAALEDQS
ncbi:MAG: valine--tRNA ligase, partial [Actinomycetota bacterium]|nr:valine--tRNA ligase [Actinomycetota bacterium]